ncbi:GpE family phage tail protein [Escherichia coli]|nr:GpE family phage tail protein [Escherichia coli]
MLSHSSALNRAFWVTEVLEWRYKAIQRSGANDE